MTTAAEVVAARTRDVPDFPRPGIVFKDLSPLLADVQALDAVVTSLASAVASDRPDLIVGIDARGFVLGALLARHLGAGLVLARKGGKLPGTVVRQSYTLEYGEESLELQADAVPPGAAVLLADDVLATGGTLAAARRLVEGMDGRCTGAAVVLEIGALQGRSVLGNLPVTSALTV